MISIIIFLFALTGAVVVFGGNIRGSHNNVINATIATTTAKEDQDWQEPRKQTVQVVPSKTPKRDSSRAGTPLRILKPKQAKGNTNPGNQPKAAKKGINGGLAGDGEFCSISSECVNGCCSNLYPGDGLLRCTPLVGGFQSDLCVGSISGAFVPTPPPVPAPTPTPLAPVPAPTPTPLAPVPTPTPAPTIPPGPQYGLQQDCLQDDSSRFNICLDLGSRSKKYERWMDAAIAARDRWQKIIMADVWPAGDTVSVRPTLEAIPEGIASMLPPRIDDIYISIVESDVDNNGPHDTLGVTGPVYTRVNSAGRVVPYYARIRIDTADFEQMYAENTMGSMIEHEIGHALGFRGRTLSDNGLASGVAGDRKYLGQFAREQWSLMGCTGDLPLALDDNTLLVQGHWDEACLNAELMTPTKDVAPSHYLSRMTIGVMKDLGYVVNFDMADAFTLDQLSRNKCGAFCPAARGDFSLEESTSSFIEGTSTSVAAAEEDRLAILSVAAAELQRNREIRPSSLPEGVEYVAGDYVTVLTRGSDGGIKATTVTWEEVEEYLASGVVV